MTTQDPSRDAADAEMHGPEHDSFLSALRLRWCQLSVYSGVSDQTPATAVVIGVSGGADSVALLHGLYRLRSDLNLTLHVAHLDHAIRPESSQDAAFVAGLAQRLKLPYSVERLPQRSLETGNLEGQARLIRYRFLDQVAHSLTTLLPTVVAVAHNADDQAETLIMHLVRGSGLHGLSAMPVETSLGSLIDTASTITLVRPLLTMRRSTIEAFLRRHQLEWRSDVTNQDLSLTRNRIRHQILPVLADINPRIVDTLGRSAQLYREEADRISSLDRALMEQLRRPSQAGRFVFELAAWRKESPAAQRGMLRLALSELGASEEARSQRGLETLRSGLLQAKAVTGPHPLAGDLAWSAAPPLAVIHAPSMPPFPVDLPLLSPREVVHRPLAAPGSVKIGTWNLSLQQLDIQDLPAGWQSLTGVWDAYLDAERACNLVLRRPKRGDRFAPLGMHGRSRALGDLFTDRKIPPWIRRNWPLIARGDDDVILWVAGIQPGHEARLRDQTRRIVRLQLRSAVEDFE